MSLPSLLKIEESEFFFTLNPLVRDVKVPEIQLFIQCDWYFL